MVYFGALFIPPGLLIGLLESTRRRRLIFGGAYLVMASASLEIILALTSGRWLLWGNVPVVAAVGGLVLVVTVAILSPANLQRSRERRPCTAAESSL
jgi:hypothetical protein